MPQQQQRGEGMQQRRWSLFGGNKDESCKSFDAPQQQQHDQQNQEDQPGPLQKFFASRRRSLDTSSVTGDTYETHPTPTQESPCTDNSSSSNNDNGSNNPAVIIEEDDEEEEEEDAELIQSLQVKLRGCDSAASTLHQLLLFQTRNLNDLKRQQTTLSTITSKFNATYTKSELDKLSNALQYAKVERRRKARQLEDAKNRKRKCDIQEERLGGELEGIRSELCRLRMEIDKDEQPQTVLHPNNQQQGQQQRNVRFGDATTSGSGGGHGHDRVVIVTTDSGRGGGNRNGSGQPQTQWKTKGIMKKKSANGVPDAS